MNIYQGKIILYGLVVLVLCCTVVFGKKITPKTCKGGGYSKIISLDITPCDNYPCTFERGTKANTTLVFTVGKELKRGKLELRTVRPISLPLDVDQPNVCKDHNLVCPLEPGKEYKFFGSVDVKSYYPPFKVTIQADVKDQDNKYAMCIQFDARIE